MTFDHELTLISKTGHTTNDMGDSIPEKSNQIILCDVQSVTRSEHYAAAAHGLRPEIVFIINQYEYNGATEVEYNGKRYTVIRSYVPKDSKSFSDLDNLELICQGVVGGVV